MKRMAVTKKVSRYRESQSQDIASIVLCMRYVDLNRKIQEEKGTEAGSFMTRSTVQIFHPDLVS